MNTPNRLISKPDDIGTASFRAVRSNGVDPLLRLSKRQSTEPVDFSRYHHLALLQAGDHSQQLRPVGASTGSLLAMDPGDIVARCPRALIDVGLASEALFFSADAQI